MDYKDLAIKWFNKANNESSVIIPIMHKQVHLPRRGTQMTRIARIFTDPCASASSAQLRDTVFEKYKDKNGFYRCAISGEKNKSKINFQIDHIKPMSKGGLTILENLQILTRKENAIKGNLYVRKHRPNFKRQKNSGFIH